MRSYIFRTCTSQQDVLEKVTSGKLNQPVRYGICAVKLYTDDKRYHNLFINQPVWYGICAVKNVRKIG